MRAGRRQFGAPLLRRLLLKGPLLAGLATVTIVSVGFGSGPGSSPQLSAATASSPRSTEFPTGYLRVVGHGWGPGVGMGQWGAFGYAAEGKKPYRWILSHFYGGSTLATLPASADGSIRVAIIGNAGYPVTVTSKRAFTFGGVKFAANTAGRATMSSTTGQFTISEAPSCSSKATAWKTEKAGITGNPQALPASLSPSAPTYDLLTLCRGDGQAETVRGRIIAYRYDNANTGNKPLIRTLNQLPLESYVADVTPAESSSGWAAVGGAGLQGEPWGFQELEAQAVAARTYLLAYVHAGGWYGYASICDVDYCQSYNGVADESAAGWAAARDTAGQYLSEKGVPIDAQYSASTGGYTTPGDFPAVSDAGDSVCLQNTGYWTCNPVHNWSVTLPITILEKAYPSIGTLEWVKVTSRNGYGDWGGRALTVRLTGSSGTVYVSGYTFQALLGLDSNWFIVGQPVSTTTTTTAPTTTTTTVPASSTTTTSTVKTTTTTKAKVRVGPSAPSSRRPSASGRRLEAPVGGGTGPLP